MTRRQQLNAAHARVKECRRALDSALRALAALRPPKNPPAARPEVRKVQQIVADYYGLPIESLWAPDRDDFTASARRIGMVLCARAVGVRAVEITAAFGRSEKNIHWAKKGHDARCATDQRYFRDYNVLFEKCRVGVAA